MAIQYLYPKQDKNVPSVWTGYPDNVNKYTNIDEGTVSPNDSDYIAYASVGSDNTLAFYLTDSAIQPSSVKFNIRGYVNISPNTGQKIYIANVYFKENDGTIISQFVGASSAYAWDNIYSTTTLNIPLSTVRPISNPINPYIEFYLSGLSVLNYIYAMDVLLSGTPIITSGLPLFISTHTIANECIQPTGIDFSNSQYSGSGWAPYWNQFAWYDNNGHNPRFNNWVQAVNSSVHTPVDNSLIYCDDSLPGIYSSYGAGPYGSFGKELYSPAFSFNKPSMDNIDSVSACFRIRNSLNYVTDPDENPIHSISHVYITNKYAQQIASWYTSPTEGFTISKGNIFNNFCLSGVAPAFNFTDTGNLLYFALNVKDGYYAGNANFSEIEICVTGTDPAQSSYIPLYTAGMLSINSGLDLYMYGYDTYNSGLDLYTSGPFPSDSGLDLYTCGHIPLDSGLNLYIDGHDISNSGVDLYTQGNEVANSGLNLYTQGPFPSDSGLTLFISGPIPVDSYMPLFTKADDIPLVFNNIPLFMFATTDSGLMNTLPMMIPGTGGLDSNMIMFTKNEEFNYNSSIMPMFLKTIGNPDGSMTFESGLQLYLSNDWIASNSGLNLYINTDSGTFGAIPLNTTMPLFIGRDSESLASFTPIYLKVADVSSGILPLCTFGAYILDSGLPLSIPNVYSENSSTLNLYVHGF